ncbi:MAG: glycosyltransferase [bacterium]|nr:glycosyltransferase [bacterium]
MKRLKTLFITAWYPDKESPVRGVFVREHAKAVQLYDGVMVLHCCRPDPERNRRLWRIERESDEALTANIPTCRVWPLPFPIPKLWFVFYVWSVWRAYRWIVRSGFRPDVIHAHVYEAAVPAVLIGRLCGIPVIAAEHSTAFPRRALKRLEVWKARLAFRWADLVAPVSRSLQKAIVGYGIKARFQIVPNVVDTRLFHPAPVSQRRGQWRRLLTVALLSPAHTKGISYLLRALAQLGRERQDGRLDVVGDGPARKDYVQLAQELDLGDRVTFHGLKPKAYVAELMRTADLLIVPSLFETFSVVAAEALASGTPVLTTRCGGPEEFVTHRVGLVVPAASEQALCEGINFMLNNLGRFDRGEISRYANELFSPQRVGEKIHKVYLACLADRRARHGTSSKTAIHS